MQCKYYGNCKHQTAWCKSNTALLKCVYGLNEYCTEKAWEIDALREENKELKRLLRLAVEDFDFIFREYSCASMPFTVRCPYSRTTSYCNGKWKHKEEAVKLIGDEDNG